MKKQSSEKNSPATQNDLEVWGGSLAFQIDEVRKDLLGHNERFDKHEETLNRHEGILESILKVLTSISGQLAEMKGNNEKLEHHEERITRLDVRSRIG